MSGIILVTPQLLRGWRPPPVAFATDKDARGRVLVLAGGAQVAGATLLTAVAAMRAGAGKLQVGAPASLATALAIALPEARVVPAAETSSGELSPKAAPAMSDLAQHSDVVVVGPGMLDEAAAGALALALVAGCESAVMVADAAAMPGLMAKPDRARTLGGRLVLTPHMGEMAKLADRPLEAVEADPLAAARAVAGRLQAVVVLKAATTFVVSPDGQAWRPDGGSPGLATSGSGDVLAGILGGLLARGAAPAQAAVWAVALHGLSGRRLAERIAPVGFLARELLEEIAPVLAELEAA